MKLIATADGTFPAGLHWSEGEVRVLDTEEPIPSWLKEVKEPKAKAKAKAKAASE